jgi:hypothetical protein
VSFTMRMCFLAVAVMATACAHAGRPMSPALAGSYRFSDAIPGLGYVSGGFEVNVTGHVMKFSGTCSPSLTPSPGATGITCSIQRLRIAGHDQTTVRAVSVTVLVSEITPSPSDRTRSDVRSRRFRGRLGAARSGM